MSVYSLITDEGKIFQLGTRENEFPLISCEVPIDEFFKMFPESVHEFKHLKIVRIVEGLFDDEITDIINKTIHLKREESKKLKT